MIGKRKRDHTSDRDVVVVRRKHLLDDNASKRQDLQNGSDEEQDVQISPERSRQLLRKYFEASFGPLPVIEDGFASGSEEDSEEEDDSERGDDLDVDFGEGKRDRKRPARRQRRSLKRDGSEDDVSLPSDLDSESDSASAWSGLSDDEQNNTENTTAAPVVQVVDYRDTAPSDSSMDPTSQKPQYKSFMSAAPPRDRPTSTSKPTNATTNDPEDPLESLNLKNDLDLQRLLRESHLLEKSSVSSLHLEGNQRHKATDLRLQSLGSKHSTFTQEKMPLSHRKGIMEKKTYREELRRKEAKENGIILEKRVMTNKKSSVGPGERKREKGVDLPGVGRFRGGMLKLNKKDLRDIQGPAARTGSGGGRGGGKKRGRR